MKARYLTFFSYIGTPFRSSEKIWLREGRNHPDPESVQGLMELALLQLRSLNYPSLVLSSRTDGGVHALNTSAHFDLEKYGSEIYDPAGITYNLNKFFYKHNSSIYVKKVIRVSDNFNARYKATGRTYLYRDEKSSNDFSRPRRKTRSSGSYTVLCIYCRLAVKKNELVLPEKISIASFIPIEEWKRCHFLRLPGFDIEKFKEGAKYFVGYHDFSTFKRFDKSKPTKHNRRELRSIEVKPGTPLITSYSREQGSVFDYWDIEIRGRAFVHNQIRRMVGALCAVAIGRLPPEEIKVMLQVPSKHTWHTGIQTGPPDGLYLCDVHYNPKDLIYNPEETKDRREEDDSECD